jgi:hypothetical protein
MFTIDPAQPLIPQYEAALKQGQPMAAPGNILQFVRGVAAKCDDIETRLLRAKVGDPSIREARPVHGEGRQFQVKAQQVNGFGDIVNLLVEMARFLDGVQPEVEALTAVIVPEGVHVDFKRPVGRPRKTA